MVKSKRIFLDRSNVTQAVLLSIFWRKRLWLWYAPNEMWITGIDGWSIGVYEQTNGTGGKLQTKNLNQSIHGAFIKKSNDWRGIHMIGTHSKSTIGWLVCTNDLNDWSNNSHRQTGCKPEKSFTSIFRVVKALTFVRLSRGIRIMGTYLSTAICQSRMTFIEDKGCKLRRIIEA